MPEDFIALATLLRSDPEAAREPTSTPPIVAVAPPDPFAHERTVGEIARLRLAACEAFERAIAHQLEAFAREVLSRELALAPADLSALAARALAAFRDDEPVRLVVSPLDATRVTSSLPIRVEPALAMGDLVVEVTNGAFESPLAFRLAATVDASLACASSRETRV